MNPILFCLGLLIQVPQDFPTITSAIEASGQGDTVWVHPGTYPEQLWLPSHDILLVSDFYFTGDSSALYNTILDASAWAEEDTASTVVITRGSTRATIFSGFTVTGGHGTGSELQPEGGAFFIRHSSPVISSNVIHGNYAWSDPAISAKFSDLVISGNLIYENRAYYGPIGLYMCGQETPAVIERNDISRTLGPPEAPDNVVPDIGASYSNVIVRSNHFHDYEGCFGLGATFQNSTGELSGNVFENLHYGPCPGATPLCGVVFISRSDMNVLDNVFLNCSMFDHACVVLNECGVYGTTPTVVGNVFENLDLENPEGGGGLWVANCEATVSQNRFTNCRGAGGAIGISIWSQFPRCTVLVADNIFDSNDYYPYEGMYQASAVFMGTDGTGKCVLQGNTFVDNQKIALNLLYEGSDSLTYYMDADSNYWGDSTGPYHPLLNPNGCGDTVAGRVDFDPWLQEPPAQTDMRPPSPIPQTFALLAPYPNPFNPGVTLPLSINRPGVFKVEIFDLLGRLVWTQTERYSAGIYRIYWPGTDFRDRAVAAGVYFARASQGTTSSPARKLVLMK